MTKEAKYLKEKAKLIEMEGKIERYIDYLRKDKERLDDFFYDTTLSSWRSGKSKDAFLRAAENYMTNYTEKIQRLEDVKREIEVTKYEMIHQAKKEASWWIW
ncbi:hypothetical protein [Bacillus massilinigeriensis]|uniref:hypothetical protein n=1 Tax=Bacillus mediterraneensis TaxID=1805474 RepID=UPI0008F8B00C|nr:hypothetical protein [Bacillus mediterraneensis]